VVSARRLDLGLVSALRSQAVYHGLAAAMDEGTPDTVVFCRPREPYLCVGYHQRADQVLDLERCRRRGWLVVRRRIGGGAVYLDPDQVFYQVIVHRRRAPGHVGQIYRRYLAAPVLVLRWLGLEASLVGPNELEVGGRRIGGTGGGHLGQAVVVVGNLLLDFPHGRMAEAWRAPCPAFRGLAREGLGRYLTTLRRELPDPPPPAVLTELLARAYAETLGTELVPGALTEREERAIQAAEAELASPRFLLAGGGRATEALKIARGVYVCMVRDPVSARPVAVRVRHGVVEALAAADGTAEDGLRARLLGRVLDGPWDAEGAGAADGAAVAAAR
jgi:lipoate-protein ligase A